MRIKSDEFMIKTTPPGNGSNLLKNNDKNPIFDYFSKDMGNIKLMVTGPFTEEDLGIKCYHSKVGALELILNHLIDLKKEYIVVDMTAGADSFASGIFTKFDVTFLVVEPTLKSLSVYKQYKEYAKNYKVMIKVLGNKVEDESDMKFLRKHIGKDLLAIFERSEFVRRSEKGEILKIEKLEKENQDTLEKMLDEVNKTKKNWDKYYKQTVEFHIKNCLSWANAQLGEDLTLQIDPYFKLKGGENDVTSRSNTKNC